jgi:hypothetical protein
MVFTLTLPGSSRIVANTSTPATSAAPNSVPSSSGLAFSSSPGSAARAISAHPAGSLGGHAAGNPGDQRLLGLPQGRADNPPDPVTGRRLDLLALQVRQQFLARTRSACRFFSHPFAASQSAALSASATEHSRNPKYLRISAR